MYTKFKSEQESKKVGLVIGKFYPPHLGHKFLIDTAESNCDELYVLVCDDKKQKINAEVRCAWLQEIHPRSTVRVIPEIYDDDNSKAWAEHTRKFLGFAPDIVFTSEDYGYNYAKFLGCKHIQVDKDRINVKISATIIRNNLKENLHFLHPIVRSYFLPRVIVLGAESTGTTTLAKSLAEFYKTNYVPEFGRIYSESLSDVWNYKWKPEDFVYIAETQNKMEDYLARTANKFLVCDTDTLATTLWEERYLGGTSREVECLIKTNENRFYILTGDEIPFVQDGTRDGESIRHEMHQKFVEKLNESKVKYFLLEGGKEERLQRGVHLIDKFIESNQLFHFK